MRLPIHKINERHSLAYSVRGRILEAQLDTVLSMYDIGSEAPVALCVPCFANTLEFDQRLEFIPAFIEYVTPQPDADEDTACSRCSRTAFQVFRLIQGERALAEERCAERERFNLVTRVAPVFQMKTRAPGEARLDSTRFPHGLCLVEWLGGAVIASFRRPRTVEAALWSLEKETLAHMVSRYADILKAIEDGQTCPACGVHLEGEVFTLGCFDPQGCGRDRHERAEQDAAAVLTASAG